MTNEGGWQATERGGVTSSQAIGIKLIASNPGVHNR
jgi:hypothetical protein